MNRDNGRRRRAGTSAFEIFVMMAFLWMHIAAAVVVSAVGIIMGMHLQVGALAVLSVLAVVSGVIFASRYGDVCLLRSSRGSGGGWIDFSPPDLIGRDMGWICVLCIVTMWFGYAVSMGYVQQMLAVFHIDFSGVSAFFRQHVFR